MNNLCKNKNLTFDDIQLLYNRSIQQLRETQLLFVKIENEPELILTKLFNHQLYQPFYAIPFEIFSHTKQLIPSQRDSKYHELQNYLKDKLLQYIFSIDSEVALGISDENCYPSNFYLSYKGYKICQFDIYFHIFKDMRRNVRFVTKNGEVKSVYLNLVDCIICDIQDNYDSIQELQKENTELEEFIKNPLKFSKKWRTKLKILRRKQFYTEKAQEKIRENLSTIKELTKSINDCKGRIDDINKIQSEIDLKYCKFLNLFVEFFHYSPHEEG